MPIVTSLLQDFHDYARGKLEGFTGREWLVEKVRAWLGRADAPPFLLILGEPGIGKSAFAAHLWLCHGLPHAVHFCIAGRSGTVEPLSFLESLNAQLKDKLPGFAEAFRQVQEEQYAEARQPIYAEARVQARYVAPGGEVTGVKIIQQIRDLPPERALDLALRRPLQRLAENGSLPQTILLVDALDEARTYFSRPNILDLLARAHDFPPPVRFILLSRLEPDILGAFREMPVEVIHAESEENRRDVTAYLHRVWEEDPALRQAVQAWGAEWDADTFAPGPSPGRTPPPGPLSPLGRSSAAPGPPHPPRHAGGPAGPRPGHPRPGWGGGHRRNRPRHPGRRPLVAIGWGYSPGANRDSS